MAYRDWAYVGSATEGEWHISCFRNEHTGAVEQVRLTTEESESMTFGEVCEKLLRQVGEHTQQDELASMLSNMLNR